MKISREVFNSIKPLMMEHAKSVGQNIISNGIGWSISNAKPMEVFDEDCDKWIFEPIVLEGQWSKSSLPEEVWDNLEEGLDFTKDGYNFHVYGYNQFLKSKSTIVLSYKVMGKVDS